MTLAKQNPQQDQAERDADQVGPQVAVRRWRGHR